ESPSKKKSAKAKKFAATKPKPTKKKAPVRADGGKGLNVLSEVALSEAAQLKEVAKRSKKDFHISHASSSCDGTDFGSGVPDEQHRKTSGTNEGTGTKLGVLDVPKCDSDDDNDANDDDNQEDDDTNDNDEETDKEKMDEEEDDEFTKELYNDVNVNLGNKDADMTDVDQGGADQKMFLKSQGLSK
ncbi:hypothetical protein Tco_0187357, partial [Tanacetum coccineum]